MGERNSGSIETEGNRTTNSSSPSTSTTSTSDGGRRGRGRPRTSGEPSEKTSQLPLVSGQPKIVAVDIPSNEKNEDKPEPKKGRGRPSGTTKKKTPAKPQGQADYQQIKILMVTLTGIVAGKMQSPVFMLTNEEAEQIAKPLANILAKNEGVSAVTSEYADHIALAFACLTIFVPKYFTYKQMKGEKKKNAIQPVSNPTTNGATTERPNDQAGKTHGNVASINRGTTPSRPSSNDSQAFNGSIIGLMPSLAGI